ncbi:hypothetical protein DFH27DRAFT_653960 [Peziza echinospora]|nr:hypothetical protein DFH27DRAFT_653960 [Peziza echinospora]
MEQADEWIVKWVAGVWLACGSELLLVDDFRRQTDDKAEGTKGDNGRVLRVGVNECCGVEGRERVDGRLHGPFVVGGGGEERGEIEEEEEKEREEERRMVEWGGPCRRTKEARRRERARERERRTGCGQEERASEGGGPGRACAACAAAAYVRGGCVGAGAGAWKDAHKKGGTTATAAAAGGQRAGLLAILREPRKRRAVSERAGSSARGRARPWAKEPEVRCAGGVWG